MRVFDSYSVYCFFMPCPLKCINASIFLTAFRFFVMLFLPWSLLYGASAYGESAVETLDRLSATTPWSRWYKAANLELGNDQVDPLVDEMVQRIKNPPADIDRAMEFYLSVFGTICQEHEVVRGSLLRYKEDIFDMVETPVSSVEGGGYARAFSIRMAGLEGLQHLPLMDPVVLEQKLYALIVRMESEHEFDTNSRALERVLISRDDWSGDFEKQLRRYLLETKSSPHLLNIYGLWQTRLLTSRFDAGVFKKLYPVYRESRKLQRTVSRVITCITPDILSVDVELTALLKAWMMDPTCDSSLRFDLALLMHAQDTVPCEQVISALVNDKDLRGNLRRLWSSKLTNHGLEHLQGKK